MVSAGNKPRKKRKDEQKNLYSAWECFGADNGPGDNNAFSGCRTNKQQVEQKCTYLDEKNIVVSHHLLSEPWSTNSEGSDVVEKFPPGEDTSPDNTLSAKCPVALPADASPLSQSTSDTYSVPANNKLTDLMIHKRNMIYGPSPLHASSLELKQTFPLIRWAPAVARVQMSKEPVAWRCKGFVKVNREVRPTELPQLWKRACDGKLDWSHGSLARLAHLREQSPHNAPSVVRTGPVIRRVVGLAAGRRGGQVRDSHVEQNVCEKTGAKQTSLPNEQGSTKLVNKHKPDLSDSLWSVTQEAARHSKQPGQQNGGHIHRKPEVISMGGSDVRLLDMPCLSGCQGNSQISTIPHDVTLLHVLQVLQSKAVHFPQVRGLRRLEAL